MKPLLVGISIFLVLLLGLEMALQVYFLSTRGAEYTVAKMVEDKSPGGIYGRSLFNTCMWFDTLYPHPYQGYTQKASSSCDWKINSLGNAGNDFPKNKENFYTILLLGGSVGYQMAQNINFIERRLNHDYVGPQGKKFRVVAGAIGGGKQPVQVLTLLKSLEKIDAFISIEGYNEYRMIDSWDQSFEFPPATYFMVSHPPDLESSGLNLFKSLREWVSRWNWLGRSYLAGMTFISLRTFVGGNFNDALKKTYAYEMFKNKEPHRQKKIAADMKQYLNYIKTLDSLSVTFKKPGILFLQPIPSLFKPLHPLEWPGRSGPDPKGYLRLEEEISRLKFKGIAFQSLLRIFEGNEDNIYFDDIHCRFDESNGSNQGYSIMAEEIAKVISKKWGFKRNQ